MSAPASFVRFGPFALDVRVGELRENGHSRLLPDQVFQVLLILLEHDGDIATREEIKKKLWPNDTVVEFDHSINAAIKKLRTALDDSAESPRYIETIPRRGYRLLAPVEWEERDEGSSGAQSEAGSAASEPSAEVVSIASLKVGRLTGKVVSHYRVLEIIGGGGMGLVYRAEDLKLGRAVALKFLPEEVGDDAKARGRFEREARVVSTLNHPNVCSIYEFDEHEGHAFLVMELLEGKTLRDHLAAGRFGLTEKSGLEIAIHVAAGLEAAHEKTIIHRDIKPANIFVTEKNTAKILDFGVAKMLETTEAQASGAAAASGHSSGDWPADLGEKPGALHETLTRTGTKLGTAGYMSPEQTRGEALDARTDIFSFGLVLYEMATGERAFSGETEAMLHEAIQYADPKPVREINPEVAPEVESIINKALEKDRDRRYQSVAEMSAELEALAGRPRKSGSGRSRIRERWKWSAAAAVVFVGIVAGALYWRLHRTPELTEQDTIVIADFVNNTLDPVFDDTLKQALSTQLSQSPYLNILSNRKVSAALSEMHRPSGEALSENVAIEVCRHAGSRAMVTGSIGQVEKEFIIGLTAKDCKTGNVLAEAQERVPDKVAVLKALDEATISIRKQMGEPLNSVRKYAMPSAEATMASLEAWKAYSTGLKIQREQGIAASLPFYKRAIEIDSTFAKGYGALSMVYGDMHEIQLSREYGRRAYELRNSLGERDRLAVEANYYVNVTGELDKAVRTYELWQRNYPKDVAPHGNLGFVYSKLGNEEKMLEGMREAMRLVPNSWIAYVNLAAAYTNLNRLEEAEEVYKQADQRNIASETFYHDRYGLAFLKGDAAQMARWAGAAAGKPGFEDLMLASQADTEGWYGRLKNARRLTRQAMDSAQRNDGKETAPTYLTAAALREAAGGNPNQARNDALAALKLSENRDVTAIAALALAQSGDIAAAEKLADELDKARPLDTLIQRYWLPTIRAAVALERKDPRRAVELLNDRGALDFSANTGVNVFLCPVFVRGEAYLMIQDGKSAAAEFQKFIDHYGLVGNFPWGALARLGVARAYALEAQSDPAFRGKAVSAYENFLSLWKDADPDIPIYKQAKAEYAKLK